MTEHWRRQVDREYSTATIGRLHVLHQALRIAIDCVEGPWADRNMRPILVGRARWWSREHRELEPLVVGSEYESTVRELIASIEEAVESIARRFDQPWRRDQTSEGHGPQGSVDGRIWTLGAIDYLVDERPILRGDIEFRKSEPIAPGLPDVVVAHLITVPGTRDQIARETHGHWGYHYHYLDSKNRRSDTLLTFDRDTAAPVMPTLCWERHAEGQKFKARAGKWGADKRESVYSVCRPDALRFKLVDFKRPASDAEVVWPLTVDTLASPAA